MQLNKVIFIIIALFGFVQSNLIFKDVASFCDQNGMRYLTITSYENKNSGDKILKMFEATKTLNIRTRFVSPVNIESSMTFHLDDFLGISRGPKFTIEYDLALKSIQSRKIKKSLLLIPSIVNETLLIENLQELKGNAFFYVALQGSTKTKFKQVISLADTQKTIVTDIELDQYGFIKERYNLQGINIISYSLPWPPFLNLEDCNDLGQACKSSGFYADYLNALGSMMNFTWDSYIDLEGNWGTTPADGIYNKSGAWSGVLGAIVNEKYHMTLNQWIWNSERKPILDFVSTIPDYHCLAMTPNPPEIDIGLFIRPFKNEAWAGVILIVATSFLVVAIPYTYLTTFYENTDGYRISSTSVWIFFLIVNAYYGGAMTMFFTTETSIPFETVEDVLRAYPDYNLMMQAGSEIVFYEKSKHASFIKS